MAAELSESSRTGVSAFSATVLVSLIMFFINLRSTSLHFRSPRLASPLAAATNGSAARCEGGILRAIFVS